jgi:hypothetical protein
VACALAGVLTAWALPVLLASVEWPEIVSKQWVDRLAHPPQPQWAPPPELEEAAVQPVSPPTPEQTPSGPTPDSPPDDTAEPTSQPEPHRAERDEAEPRQKPAPPKPSPDDAPDAPRDVTYKVDRRAISKIIRSPADLARHGRFVPNVVDGQRRGFKFVDVAAGGLFDRLGVRRGDVVLEVNGRALTTQTKLIEDLKALRSAHVYVVRIQRDDTTRIHRYDAGPPLKRKTGPAANAH